MATPVPARVPLATTVQATPVQPMPIDTTGDGIANAVVVDSTGDGRHDRVINMGGAPPAYPSATAAPQPMQINVTIAAPTGGGAYPGAGGPAYPGTAYPGSAYPAVGGGAYPTATPMATPMGAPVVQAVPVADAATAEMPRV